MDFEDTPEEAAFRGEARDWLDANAQQLAPGEAAESAAAPNTGDRAELMRRAKAWQATKADGGWACITWPVEYGGRAATPIQSVIWGQEEARYRVPPSMFVIGQGMLGPTIMAHGRPDQKARYLEKMLRADEVWCQLFSEPGAGSDLAGLRTASARDGDEWLINGQKIWTSGASYADFGMIVTRSDPHAAKHAGITYFIVDMKSPGIEIRPIVQMNGVAGFSEVFFSDVRVPDSNRIGEVNDGWRCALTTLMNERAALGGSGQAGFGMADLVRLAQDTELNGRPAIEDRSVRQRLADFYVKSQGLDYTRYRTLTALSKGQTPGPENSLGKMVRAPLRQQMMHFAVELLGSSGAAMDSEFSPAGGGFQQAYLAAPGGRLAGGTDEILHNIVAERVLRLPPDARMDKGLPFKDIPSGSDR